MNVLKSKLLENNSNVAHGFIYGEEELLLGEIARDNKLNKIHSLKQIHSDNVILLEDVDKNKNIVEGDSLVTQIKNEGVAVFTADCVPIIIYEKISGFIAAVHAGWKGTLKEIAVESVRKIKLRSNHDHYEFISAIGPAIGKCCYEVGEDVASQFISKFGDDENYLIHLENGKSLLDLVNLNKRQLKNEGIKNIDIIDSCTKCDKLLPSYRRDGEMAGRMLSFISIL